MKKLSKQAISFILTVLILLSSIPVITVSADNDTQRYTVLVLEIMKTNTFLSGGETIYEAPSAIDLVKQSALKFIEDVLNADGTNKVAIVAYNSTSKIVSHFSSNITTLTEKINALSSAYNSNISAGLETANALLSSVDDGENVKKNIVLITTGYTNNGEYNYTGKYNETTIASNWYNNSTNIHLYAYANHAIEVAEELKQEAKLYTIGLFSIYDKMPEEGKNIVNFFKLTAKDLATSEKYFYEVVDPNNLRFTFGDIVVDILGSSIAGRRFDKNIDYFTSYTLSSEYNPELANMTAALSNDVYDEQKIQNAYTSLGFDYELCDYDGAYNPLSSGCVIGYKKSIYNDDTIILVTVRGSIGSKLTGSDWHGNYLIATNSEGKQIGFSEPADRIYDHINRIIKNNNISGKIRYVITGHSRGAAVANLLAVRLMEKGVSAPCVYNYNFACPDVACKFAFADYINIFNLCNREDPVPFTPGIIADALAVHGTSWGKFGQTYWFTKDNENTMDPFADHSIKLYLEFFDQQKMPEDWGMSFLDKVDDTLNWARGVIAKIFCPVDVIVKDTDGNCIASVIGGEVNYYDSNFGDVIIFTDGDKKAIFVSGDKDFNIELIGTDDGTMTYSVEKCNLMTEEIFESKTFENVKLEKGKEMYSPVSNAETTEDIELFVVVNKNGEYVSTHIINTDGTETVTNCSCKCHGNAFMQFLHKIATFLRKLFGMSQYQYCDCGKAHW